MESPVTNLESLPVITTERLILRPLSEGDTDAVFDIFSDPEVMRFWNTPPMTDRKEAARYIADNHEAFRQNRHFRWGIALGEDSGVIGECVLLNLDSQHRRAEVGYALGRFHWGHGYMKEALAHLLEFAFGSMGLNRIAAYIDPPNVASIRVVQKLGFRQEGCLRERRWANGEAFDSLVYALLRREWREQDSPLI